MIANELIKLGNKVVYRVINLKSDCLFSALEADGGPAQALISNILAYFENFTIARHIFTKYIFLKTAS